ncbi:type II pantothenate kinase [Paenibacillus kobensis]|uniref:type II pantothenate kinase n=1 Tax=Paenibacillus kobensis TaxID=59841 RepID=UPI000FDC9C43|nr:type II pantothenate kinase [Paenibacillus kobensis]
MKIGIDLGGSLIKTACLENETLTLKKYSLAEFDQLIAWLHRFDSPEICITGGRAFQLKSRITENVTDIVEFAATIKGSMHLLHKEGLSLDSYILTNVGTGTSIHAVLQGKHERLGGTGVGGGTLMGLSKLLTGITDFDEIVTKASSGTRSRIDMKVSDIYRGSIPPIAGDLTASNFGKLFAEDVREVHSVEDLLSSVVGIVGETVATTSVLAAGQYKDLSIVYIGSTFNKNKPLQDVVYDYTNLRGATPIFLKQGEFCGAIGALLSIG